MRYPPLRYYLEKVLRDRGGGISHWHWAAKGCVERKSSKTQFFLEAHDNNILKVQILLTRKFVVVGQAPALCGAECTAVAAIQLRMRMRILTRPENSLANFSHQTSKKKLRIRRCEGIR